MAEKEAKIATVIITVDSGCGCSFGMINCALCQLHNRFKINSIVFDEKKSTVTVSGAFNPESFIKEISCLAHNVIKKIEIKKDPPPPPPPPPPPKANVNVSISICSCCQPRPCYQPHHGCCRCWSSCGHLS